MRSIINKILNIGVKTGFQPWEIYLTRKINMLTLIAMFNMVIGNTFFFAFGYYQFIGYLSVAFFAAPLIFIFNHYKNYIWGIYAFNIIGFIFFFFVNMAMGIRSYVIVFYFPVIISMVQFLGRRETIKHLVILGALCFLSILAIVIGFRYDIMTQVLPPEIENDLAIFNILVGFFTAIAFIVVVVNESLAQERLIKNMLTEKEVLLAEVYHRVKNNMNIVTSLLNLKKNSTDSFEVREALEECRNRVYSMALVHQKVFNSKDIARLNFKDYAEDLMKDILDSLSGSKTVETHLHIEDVQLELTNAIPCGLILNELITNSYKHAGEKGKQIEISVTLKQMNGVVELEVRDNGPGIEKGKQNKPNSLGIELIKSLAEQIGGEYSFTNDNGLVFKLRFKQ